MRLRSNLIKFVTFICRQYVLNHRLKYDINCNSLIFLFLGFMFPSKLISEAYLLKGKLLSKKLRLR